MDTVSENALSELSLPDANVIYYVTGFIAKSLTKSTNCPNSAEIL